MGSNAVRENGLVENRPGAKRICHLTSVHPAFDTRIFYKECRSLVKAGYEVTLVAPHSLDQTVEGVRIKALPLSRNRFMRMLDIGRRTYIMARAINADLYHFHDPELIIVGLALRMEGRKIIYDIHEDAPRTMLSPGRYYLPFWSRRAVSWLLEKIENIAAPLFAACITATPYIERRFQRIQPKTYTINNFPLMNELLGEKPISWKERQNSSVYVGSISMPRGLRGMVGAMGQLPDNLEASLKLVGKYAPLSCRDEVRHLRGWGRIEELGFLGRNDIRSVLGQVKVGLVLLHSEPRFKIAQPVKLFEYMSAGIPVIASDFPLWRKIVEQAGCGLLVNPLDSGAIATAIEYLLTHDIQAEEMGRRGRKAIEQRYNWTTESEHLLNIYKNIFSA